MLITCHLKFELQTQKIVTKIGENSMQKGKLKHMWLNLLFFVLFLVKEGLYTQLKKKEENWMKRLEVRKEKKEIYGFLIFFNEMRSALGKGA